MRLMPAFAFVFLLLSAQAFAAGDSGDAPLRSFCMRLLNISASAPANETNATIFAPPNITTRSAEYYDAVNGLALANLSIQRMADASLPVLRAFDTYVAAVQWLEGQSAIEEIGGTPDYAFVTDSVEQINRLSQSSFALQDEFDVLSLRLQNATEGANLTAATATRDAALAEFRDGRLEEAQILIDQSYSEISSAESDAIQSRTLVESTRKNVESFVRDNWKTFAAAFAAAAILAFIFQKRIRRFIVSSKINSLMHEKEVLQGMLRTLQRDYFERGSVNEMSYHVKTKKFGDLIRNINRQLPLLKEELKRI
jgi:hypothetical protein